MLGGVTPTCYQSSCLPSASWRWYCLSHLLLGFLKPHKPQEAEEASAVALPILSDEKMEAQRDEVTLKATQQVTRERDPTPAPGLSPLCVV